MSTKYKISKSAGFGLILLALIFDAIQWATPQAVDTLITAIATMVFGMIFMEKGVLTMSAKGALKIFRWLVPFAEIIISSVPGITLEVWILIKISRLADTVLPEKIHTIWGLKHIRKDVRDIKNNWKIVKKTTQNIGKYTYGKGRRGARTLARKTQQHTRLASKGTERKQRALTAAKTWSKHIHNTQKP